MRIVEAGPGDTLLLGRLGENEATAIRFNVSAWIAEYPGASVSILYKAPEAKDAYPISAGNAVLSDGSLTWSITSAELANKGQGKAELVLVENDTVVKSAIWNVRVLPALDGSGEPPEPWESWQTAMTRIAAEVAADADRAGDAAAAVENLGAEAETLAAGSEAAVQKTVDPETGAVTLTFGIPQGAQGKTGNGIASITLNADYTLTLTMTDGTSYTTPSIRGAKGDPGEDYVLTAADKQEIADLARELLTVSVSGTDPTIAAAANTSYECGEAYTLGITLPASGMVDVTFTSGSTPTVLTISGTVSWPEWFDATALEANTTYEINILNGRAVVTTWQA